MKLVFKEADASEEGSIAARMRQVTSKREAVTVAQQASSSAPVEDRKLEADPEALAVNPLAQQSSSSATLEDKELDADPEAVTVNQEVQQDTLSTPLEDREQEADPAAVTMKPEAQLAFSSAPLQDRGMDAETKPAVVEVSIFQQESAKKHKVIISTRSKFKKSKEAKKSTKDDREEGKISD